MIKTIWVDKKNGVEGREIGYHGYNILPCNNLPDAFFIAKTISVLYPQDPVCIQELTCPKLTGLILATAAFTMI